MIRNTLETILEKLVNQFADNKNNESCNSYSQKIIRKSISGIKTPQNAGSILEALQVPKLSSRKLGTTISVGC